MPLSKKRDRERKRRLRRLGVTSIMSSADVRAMRMAGLNPEDVGDERGKVSSSVYYALMRDRDAIKAHLSWHHESVKYSDIGTVVERQGDEIGQLQARVIQLEAGMVVHEVQDAYQLGNRWED